jgi:hypothetical protein
VIGSPLDGTHCFLPQWMTEEAAEYVGMPVEFPCLSIISLKRIAILLDKDLLKDRSFSGGHHDKKNGSYHTTLRVSSGRYPGEGTVQRNTGNIEDPSQSVDPIGSRRPSDACRRRKPKGGH